jgi:tRNA(Arg) A34 adenosine deaminase TadA
MLKRLVQAGANIACRSPVASQHVCFIVTGKSILSVAVNTYDGVDTCHAEMAALRRHCQKCGFV